MTAKETLSVEEEEILHALDEVEQTIEAMSSVLADLRQQLADHLQNRTQEPTAVLDDWPFDDEQLLH